MFTEYTVVQIPPTNVEGIGQYAASPYNVPMTEKVGHHQTSSLWVANEFTRLT